MNKKEIFMQPNNLIKSKYDFTSVENKLFYKILFNAQKQKDNSKLYYTKVTKHELKEFIMNRNDYQSKNIKEVLNMFQQSVLEFDYIDDHTGKLMTFGSGLIISYTLDHSEQIYTIEIHETLYKHITDFIKMQKVGNGYTPINLALLFNFRGVYTQRLYTFLRRWSREGKEVEVKYKLEELRNCLKLNQDMYSAYKYFKQNVLKRAMKEINDSGNMQVKIKDEIRKNRKVDEIVFSVIDYEPRKYFKDKENSIKNVLTKTEANDEKVNIIDFYIPNKKLFTAKTLKDFIADFSSYDFKDGKNKEALQLSIMATLNKDDEEKIKVKAYNYFKATLEDKLNLIAPNSNENIKKTKFHNFNETFTQYSSNELDEIIDKSQLEKYNDEVSVTVEQSDNTTKNFYNRAIKEGWKSLPRLSLLQAIKYAKENGLYYPKELE